MIEGLKPYPMYKKLGLPWLAEIPGHWGSSPVKQEFVIQLGKMLQNAPRSTADVPVPYLKSQHVQWSGVRTIDLPKMWATPSDLRQFEVRTGDLLVCEGGEGGRCAVVTSLPSSAIIQNALHRVRQRADGDNRFLAYAMAVISSLGWFLAVSSKATIAHFTKDKFSRMEIPLPPPDEQTAIVRFLDHANGRLGRAIRAKKKLIALLNEQKQAIIHRAVTRGLDPDVPLKPSGIPWLGDIPQHWEVVSLRMRYSVELGKMLDTKRLTGCYPVPYLRNRDVQWDRVMISDLPVMDIAPSEFDRYTRKPGDMLVCEGGQVGRSAFWAGALPACGFQKALHRLRFLDGNRDLPRFLFYQIRLAAARGVFAADGNENTFAHLTCEKLRRHRFAFPPLAEQKAIVRTLDDAAQGPDIVSGLLDREVNLLREYRTRLVADVVTGKLDVREAAARLPEDDVPESVEHDAGLDEEAETAAEVAI
ncbi:MAG: restriction endonuclease subunit S [Terriglobales bacterium]